jgi:hypothetical protein
LREAKQVPARPVQKHVLGEGEGARGAIGGRRDIEERIVLRHDISVTNEYSPMSALPRLCLSPIDL